MLTPQTIARASETAGAVIKLITMTDRMVEGSVHFDHLTYAELRDALALALISALRWQDELYRAGQDLDPF